MWLTQGILHTKVSRASDAEIEWLRSKESGLAFSDKKALYATGKVGLVRFFDVVDSIFPAGFTPTVVERARAAGLKVEVIDGRQAPVSPIAADLGWLRDYQLAAVEEVISKTRGILNMVTGCLSGDSIIECNRAGKSFNIALKDLVHRQNGGRVTWNKSGRAQKEKGAGMRWDPSIPTTVRSRDEDGYIRLKTLAAAISSGVQTTYSVRTDTGLILRATANHRFLTIDGWKRLHELSVIDVLCVDSGDANKPGERRKKHWYRLVGNVRLHPHAGRRGVGRAWGGWSVPMHRLVAEAGLNHVSYDEYVARLRSGPIDPGWVFLDPKEYAVHHIDEDPFNNVLQNLAVLTRSEHGTLHGEDGGWRRVTAKTGFSRITSIEKYGEEHTYDLAMAGEPHNFLANGIVVHNSGKTEVAIGLVKRIPCRWLFLVHRKTLMEQAAQRYELRCPGEEAGRIGEGAWAPQDRFTVATFQTLAAAARKSDPRERVRLAAFLGQFQGVIVDEVHVLPSETWNRVAMSLVNAYWRVGISGTPLDREDQRSVYAVAATGPVIYKMGGQELIERGLLARPIIRLLPVRQDFQEVDKQGFIRRWPWQKVYEEGVVRSKERNRALLAAVARAEKPCLVFVKEIAHGKAFHRALEQRGQRAEFVWGSASLQIRQAAVRRLVRGDVDVLVSSVIFQEGVDIPELRSVVIASGGKSIIATLQRIGRGMRLSAGKDAFEVWDVQDLGNAWLERHAKARRGAYTREGYAVSVVQMVPEAARGESKQGAFILGQKEA